MNDGLLRFHNAESGPVGQEFVGEVFGRRGLAADVFAFDWLARQFAVTDGLTPEGIADGSASLRTVVVLDPFDLSVTPWVEVTEFEHALSTPLAQEFLNYKFFREWLSVLGQDHLEFDSCAGVNVPGFYGGARELSDLSHDSNEVYLSFVQQLWEQRLANGTGAAATHLVVQEEL